MTDKKRIDEAVEAGEFAFWAEVAEVFYEWKSHHYEPTTFSELRSEMKRAVEEWVRVNSHAARRFGDVFVVPPEIDGIVAAGILHDDSDTSTCPSFSHRCEGASVVLRIESADSTQADRHTERANHFSVYIQPWDDSCPPDEYIYDGDNVCTAVEALNAAIAARDRVARHVARIYDDLNTVVKIAAIVEQGILAGRADDEIADMLSNDSGLNGEQMAELIHLGRTPSP